MTNEQLSDLVQSLLADPLPMYGNSLKTGQGACALLRYDAAVAAVALTDHLQRCLLTQAMGPRHAGPFGA